VVTEHLEEIFDAVRGRVLRDVEIQAAQAGRKN